GRPSAAGKALRIGDLAWRRGSISGRMLPERTAYRRGRKPGSRCSAAELSFAGDCRIRAGRRNGSSIRKMPAERGGMWGSLQNRVDSSQGNFIVPATKLPGRIEQSRVELTRVID